MSDGEAATAMQQGRQGTVQNGSGGKKGGYQSTRGVAA